MERTVSAQKTPKTTSKRRIFIVDDHPIVRQGLTQLIDNEPDLVVCGQGEDAYQALKLIRQQRDKRDRRVVWTQISPAGLGLLAETDPIVQNFPKYSRPNAAYTLSMSWTRRLTSSPICDSIK